MDFLLGAAYVIVAPIIPRKARLDNPTLKDYNK